MISHAEKVLDLGFVRLANSMGDDLTVVRAARVSYDADWRAGEDEGKDKKLIEYMIKNEHTSPFEAVIFTFEVKAPIFVFRQWHRHRTWSYNELSARYGELDAEFYIPETSYIGTQSKSNKQAREFKALSSEEAAVAREQIDHYTEHCEYAFGLYKSLLEKGWPRELARAVLPVSTYSRMHATVDLHNLLHFLKLRLHPHAQYEIRVYADAMLRLITPVVPVTIEAWRKHNDIA